MREVPYFCVGYSVLITTEHPWPYVAQISTVHACAVINNEHLMCLMHVELKTEFWICHIQKLYNAKQKRQLLL